MDRDNIHLHHPPHRDLHKTSMGSGRQHEDRGFFQENGEVPQEEENWGSLQWRKKPKWHLEERKNEVPWKSQKPLQEMEQVLGAATWWCTYGLMFLWSLCFKRKRSPQMFTWKKNYKNSHVNKIVYFLILYLYCIYVVFVKTKKNKKTTEKEKNSNWPLENPRRG